MSTIVIMGAAGFIGARAVRRFVAEGHSVHIFTRPHSSLWRLDKVRSAVKNHRIELWGY